MSLLSLSLSKGALCFPSARLLHLFFLCITAVLICRASRPGAPSRGSTCCCRTCRRTITTVLFALRPGMAMRASMAWVNARTNTALWARCISRHRLSGPTSSPQVEDRSAKCCHNSGLSGAFAFFLFSPPAFDVRPPLWLLLIPAIAPKGRSIPAGPAVGGDTRGRGGQLQVLRGLPAAQRHAGLCQADGTLRGDHRPPGALDAQSASPAMLVGLFDTLFSSNTFAPPYAYCRIYE